MAPIQEPKDAKRDRGHYESWQNRPVLTSSTNKKTAITAPEKVPVAPIPSAFTPAINLSQKNREAETIKTPLKGVQKKKQKNCQWKIPSR